jgi:16S rRNA (adenine1518-N6/adenine1519-N6)-dimethyltransferase
MTQTISYLAKRFREVGLSPDTRHGQHFLIDLNLLRLLVDRAALGPRDVVLEVGTGSGSLTAVLAERAGHVVTVELDPRLYQLASEELAKFSNVTMLRCDALYRKNRVNPEVIEAVRRELAAAPGRRCKLAANLPYNVATPLVANLLAAEPPTSMIAPVSMTVTVQREVADRLAAAPGTKDYGALSVWVQSQCMVEVVRVLPPSVFWPRPKVHSAIVHVELDPARRAKIADRACFHDFARAMFLHRRKYLRTQLLLARPDELSKSQVDAILAELNLDPESRAETLSVDQMLALSAAVRRTLGTHE